MYSRCISCENATADVRSSPTVNSPEPRYSMSSLTPDEEVLFVRIDGNDLRIVVGIIGNFVMTVNYLPVFHHSTFLPVKRYLENEWGQLRNSTVLDEMDSVTKEAKEESVKDQDGTIP